MRKKIILLIVGVIVILMLMVCMHTQSAGTAEKTATTTGEDNNIVVNYANIQDVKDGYKYASHEPIYLNGNDDFTEENGVTGGNGTESDPYIIEEWDINASGADGIEIRNTDVYFIIRNCVIHDGWTGDWTTSHYGIWKLS